MKRLFILSIDQGTTGSTAALVDAQGQWVGSKTVPFEQIFPQPGWVEHQPSAIWDSVKSAVIGVLKEHSVRQDEIQAIGITNQRETTLIWDALTHEALHNAIVWQCRRTTDRCESLKRKAPLRQMIKKKTGLVLDPYFSATKIEWLLKNAKGAKESLKKGTLRAGTIDSYLIWKLTQGESHVTEVSNASRTLLMDLKTLQWDPALLKIFGLPLSILPKILSSNGFFGQTKGLGFLPDGIPIHGVLGDQQAALFGQTCFNPGEAKCTFGTGSFILANTGSKIVSSQVGMLTTVAWSLSGKTTYALEGGAFICGAAVQWLRDGLRLISSSEEIENLARSVPDTGGVEFVPALSGLGAPFWDPQARGMIAGLTRGSTSGHIARATLEAMALQNADILRCIEKDTKKTLRILRVDGGATVNSLLMQLQSDYLAKKVERPLVIETTAYGAALMAGLGAGVWKSLSQLKNLRAVDQTYSPQINHRQRQLRFESWNQALRRVRLK